MSIRIATDCSPLLSVQLRHWWANGLMPAALSACSDRKYAAALPGVRLSLSRYFVQELAFKDTPRNQLAVYLIYSRVYGLLHPRYLFLIDDGDRFYLFFEPCHLVFPARQFHLVRCARRPLRRGLRGICFRLGRGGRGQIFQQLYVFILTYLYDTPPDYFTLPLLPYSAAHGNHWHRGEFHSTQTTQSAG